MQSFPHSPIYTYLLHTQQILPFPGPAAQALFGDMGNEMLLGGQRAVPKKLLAAGFTFNDADILSGVKQALKE